MIKLADTYRQWSVVEYADRADFGEGEVSVSLSRLF